MRLSNRAARRIALIAGVAIFAGALILGFLGRRQVSGSPADPSVPSDTATGAASPSGQSRVASARAGGAMVSSAVAPAVPARQRLSAAEVDGRWRRFQAEFGSQLSATFTEDHRIANIRSGDTPASPVPGFQSGDRDAALGRARQILNQAGDLIGLNSSFPLAHPAVRTDEISSQIEWVQTYDGIPIEPFGRVTIQLDSQGGLRGLYSNYISDPSISNEPTLDAGAAQESAISELPLKPVNPGQISRGQLVLFAGGPQDGSQDVSLRYAYRFLIDGREVVVDASDGKILSDRDRREF